MIVMVHLHTTIRDRLSQRYKRQFEMELVTNSRVNNLLEMLQIEISEDALIIVVNGKVVSISDTLKNGDRVDIIPAIAGG
jgi:sulfur carrier protein ThiS